jgi:prefoldin beta subunit
MSQELPPQVQNQLMQLQQLQQQAQMIGSQKTQMTIELKEIDMALNELEKVEEETTIYRNIGGILVKSRKDDVVKELSEKKETLEVRIKTLERQEERIKKRFDELQEKIKEFFGPPRAQ